MVTDGGRLGRRRQSISVRARELRDELFPPYGLNTVDAAHVLGVDASTVRRYIRDGKLEAIKTGREFLIREENLRAFIMAKREQEKAERLEAARVARVEKEIGRYIARARQAGRAGEVALAWCRVCGHRSPVTLDADPDGGMITWQGCCRFCPEQTPLGDYYDAYTPLADDDLEIVTGGQTGDEAADDALSF